MIALLRIVPVWVWPAIVAALTVTLLLFMLSSVTSQRDRISDQLVTATEQNKSIRETLRLQRDLYTQVTAVNDGYDRKVQQLQAEKDQLDRDLADGKRGLSVKATCVLPRPRTDSAPVSQPDEASPRLTDSAQRDYLNLRSGIIQQASQITGLQEYITNVCLRGQVK